VSHPHRPLVRRVAPAATALAIAAAGLAIPLAPGAHATSTFAFSRPFDGADRYDTAAKIAVGSGFSNVANVVIATGEQFPDALAGSPLASALGSPVLLTAANSVPNTTGAALVSLKATNVTLLGGKSAIGTTVENDLKSRGYAVDRVAGIDRYDTALQAAKAADAKTPTGKVNGETTAFLATGEGFADALAAGPASYEHHLPILLTTSGALSPSARQGITDLGVQKVVILGGTAAVSAAVEAQVKAMSGVATVERLGGVDRTATATKVGQWAIDSLGFTSTHVNLARGDRFADALAGAPHGGREKAVTLLANSPTALDAASNANTTFLNAHASTLESGHIFGGTAAISPAVESAAETAGGAAPPEAPAGQSTPDVKKVVVAEDYFVSTLNQTYFYDAGDTFKVKGATLAGVGAFEQALSAGDRVTVTYDPNASGTSTFDITNDTVVAPGKAQATVENVNNSAGGADDVRVTTVIPTGNAVGVTYTLQRASYPLPGCNGPLGAFADVTGTSADINDGEAVDLDVASGCYVYRVVAKQANGATANGAPSGNVTVPGPADTTAPTITDVKATTDAGTKGVVDAGDVHTFTFSENMDTAVDADGSTYRISDADGTQVDIVCGAATATCSYTTVPPIISGSQSPVFQMTVTIKAVNAVSAGTVAGLQYPATILSVSSGWKDTSGNALTLSGSDTTIGVA
jgi:putative cell wall-binding protein